MKKTKVVRVFICSCILLTGVTSCEQKNQKSEEKQEIVNTPKDIISLKEADALYNNYSKHRVAPIENYEAAERSTPEKFEAARFVDFDYQTIKDYIAYIDQEAAKAGVKKVTKLRLYFANYPNKNTFSDGKKVVHKRQNSIFMTPTLEKDGKNYSFYIGDNGKPKLIIDWKMEQQKGLGSHSTKRMRVEATVAPKMYLNSSLYNPSSLVLNHGGSGPPPKTEF